MDPIGWIDPSVHFTMDLTILCSANLVEFLINNGKMHLGPDSSIILGPAILEFLGSC